MVDVPVADHGPALDDARGGRGAPHRRHRQHARRRDALDVIEHEDEVRPEPRRDQHEAHDASVDGELPEVLGEAEPRPAREHAAAQRDVVHHADGHGRGGGEGHAQRVDLEL